MDSRRTIGGAGLALACALLGACRSNDKRPAHQKPASGADPPTLSAELTRSAKPNPAASLAAALIAETLRTVHEQKLEIIAPSAPMQRLEFGLGRVAQASEDQVIFRDTARGELVTKAIIGRVRAISHGSDGSLFALGATEGARLDPRAPTSTHFARAPFLPGSLLFPVLEDSAEFDVYLPLEGELFRYKFQSQSSVIASNEAQYPLEGCTGAVALLRDGAFVCRTATGFARKAPRGHRSEFVATAPLPEPLRLLPAKRLDEFFSVSAQGEVQQLRLAAGLPLLAHFRLPALPYAAAGNGDALAFVTVSAPVSGQARRWTLLVYDFQGQPRLNHELATQVASAGEDWLEAMVEDKNLAISGFEPLVAVGGATGLMVWDYEHDRPRFAR